MTTGSHRPRGIIFHFTRGGSTLLLALVLALAAGCGGTSPTEPPLDLTGRWTLTVEGVCQGPLDVVQTGNTFSVTGSIGGGLCPFSASGSGDGLLDGRTIQFGIGFGSGADQGGTGLGTISFRGSVEPSGNLMNGSYEGTRAGSWQATRN